MFQNCRGRRDFDLWVDALESLIKKVGLNLNLEGRVRCLQAVGRRSFKDEETT